MLRAIALACLFAQPVHAGPLRLPGGTPTPVSGTALSLTLTDVQDQRCPPEVDCYWEGMIRLTLTVTPTGGAVETVVLCNLCDGATREATVAGHILSLTGLDPTTADLAALGRAITLADYTAIVAVVPAP
jgi:hypothetical protein